MISSIIYLIGSIVVGIFCGKIYLSNRTKKGKNPFTNYFFWVTLFVSIAFLKSAIIIPIYIFVYSDDLLFWTDFAGRALFYAAAIFSVRIPFYKFFPKSKKTVIFSYISAIIGSLLLVYQLTHRNVPVLSDVGIVNWNADNILAAGMAVLLIIPWAVTSFVFIREFVKSKFSLVKSFLLGLGFFSVCVGAIFQDLSGNIFSYISFGIILVAGFLFMLAGMFYEEKDA